MTLNLAHLSAASPSQSILKTKDPLAPSWLQIHRYLLHLLTKSPNRKSMSSRGWVKAPHKGIPFPGLPGSQIGLTMRGCFLVCYKTDRRNRCRSVQEAAVLLGAIGASDECTCCPWRPFPSEQVGSGGVHSGMSQDGRWERGADSESCFPSIPRPHTRINGSLPTSPSSGHLDFASVHRTSDRQAGRQTERPLPPVTASQVTAVCT